MAVASASCFGRYLMPRHSPASSPVGRQRKQLTAPGWPLGRLLRHTRPGLSFKPGVCPQCWLSPCGPTRPAAPRFDFSGRNARGRQGDLPRRRGCLGRAWRCCPGCCPRRRSLAPAAAGRAGAEGLGQLACAMLNRQARSSCVCPTPGAVESRRRSALNDRSEQLSVGHGPRAGPGGHLRGQRHGRPPSQAETDHGSWARTKAETGSKPSSRIDWVDVEAPGCSRPWGRPSHWRRVSLHLV